MEGSRWRVLTKCGPLEKGMASHFSILALNPMNSMKRQKGMTLKDKSPQVSNMLLEKSGEIASEKK